MNNAVTVTTTVTTTATAKAKAKAKAKESGTEFLLDVQQLDRKSVV